MKFQRALLAAHLERPEPTLRDAGRKRGEAVEQGRGRQHAIVRLAARLLDPRGCVHRVADQRDLLLQVAEFADGDRAAVKAGAEVGDKTELALICGAACVRACFAALDRLRAEARGFARGARNCNFLRNSPTLGESFRTDHCSGVAQAPVPQPLLHRRIAFPIRDSGQEHQVLALAPSREDWHSVRKRA